MRALTSAAVKKPVLTSSETEEQEAAVEYCDLLHIPIVHIPNEGKRSLSYAAMLRKGATDERN